MLVGAWASTAHMSRVAGPPVLMLWKLCESPVNLVVSFRWLLYSKGFAIVGNTVSRVSNTCYASLTALPGIASILLTAYCTLHPS